MHCPFYRSFFRKGDALERAGVIGDQIIFPEKKIELTRRKNPVLPAVVYRMNDDKQVRRELVFLFRGIIVDFWGWALRNAVFDRKRVEMKDFLQHVSCLFGCGA